MGSERVLGATTQTGFILKREATEGLQQGLCPGPRQKASDFSRRWVFQEE